MRFSWKRVSRAPRLEREITENVLADDFPRALSILRRLKSLGVRIAMDDFGTCYSSPSYLQSFPFDKIKIDKSFISGVRENLQSSAIVRAVINLGRGLQLPVVARRRNKGSARVLVRRSVRRDSRLLYWAPQANLRVRPNGWKTTCGGARSPRGGAVI
jgi:predicted signal transduction protein with EAL and GGDEF domain